MTAFCCEPAMDSLLSNGKLSYKLFTFVLELLNFIIKYYITNVFTLLRIKIISCPHDWKDGKSERILNPGINRNHIIDYKNSSEKIINNNTLKNLFVKIDPSEIGIDFIQKENNFDDFKLQLLLPQKQSEKSSPLSVGDVNNDGLDDFFVGNSKGQKAALYIQQKNGKFLKSNESLFELENIMKILIQNLLILIMIMI